MEKLFEKLLGRTKPLKLPNNKKTTTAPLNKRDDGTGQDTALEEELRELADVALDLPQLIVGCAQSDGQQRGHNEDALFTLTTNLTQEDDNLLLGLYIIADGMGGHKHGEIASGIAARSMGKHVMRQVFMSLITIEPSPPEDPIQEIMQESVHQAHRAILDKAPGGGTTLTAALIAGGQITIAHVGDSRAYLITKDGEIKSLTRDHSLVMRMIEMGQISEEEAAMHPQRNVLYRALGQGEPFDPDVISIPLPESGFLLLCSDGLWGLVAENLIAKIITSSKNPQQACQLLVDAANLAGGPDNITAIVVQLPE